MSMSVGETTLMQDIGSYLRHQLRSWRGMIVAAVILAVSALWFGWPWLVAAGLAPLILAMAPCAVMCALGLCMHRPGKTLAVSSDRPEASAGSILPRISAGAEPESSFSSSGACCASREVSAETSTPDAPGPSLQTEQKEIIQ